MNTQHLASLIGRPITRLEPLHGGCIAEVYRLHVADGDDFVAKVAHQDGKLHIEGAMLQYLTDHSQLPLPRVVHTSPDLLIMTHLPGNSHFGASEQEHAADLLAQLHSVTAPYFGLDFDTLIGSLHQPNPPAEAWIPFFAEHRLLYMGDVALRAGELPTRMMRRLEAFCEHLDRWLIEPDQPALIHGDMWTTNILAHQGRITGFLDPAIYYAHPEIELAFSTLFGTFSTPFFRRYDELNPISTGFFEERRDIYNLYPLLVHVRLFGVSYLDGIDNTLRRFGF